jgi:hypothetical protein
VAHCDRHHRIRSQPERAHRCRIAIIDDTCHLGFDTRVRPTTKQQAYLRFIRDYIALHRQSPAEADMATFFRVSPPAVHQMVVSLTEKGLITREPGQARSIRLVEVVADPAAPGADTWQPSRPPDDITAPLDPEIAPLVEALRADSGVVTKASCSGHGKTPAYIDLAVDGIEGLRVFVERMNRVDRRIRSGALFEIMLNWSEEVVTSCAFDIFPTWIMLSWQIEGARRGGAPSATLLSKIAEIWRAALSVQQAPGTHERTRRGSSSAR